MPENELQLRSEEVQEILTRMPHWMIRWGNLLVLTAIVITLLMSYIIKYPDVITTNIVLTTGNPPEKLLARSTGRIQKIFVKNYENVSQGTPLAVIENTADYKAVFQLKSLTDNLKVDDVNFVFPFEKFKGTQLGDIGGTLSVFEKDYLAYRLNKDLHPYQVEGYAQGYEHLQLQDRMKLLIEQKELAEKELELKKKELTRYEQLYKKGVIAGQEWDTKNLEYLQYEKNIRNLTSSISQTKSSLNELNKNEKNTEINDTKDQVNFYRNTIQSYNQLKKAIADWELDYVLRTTISGKLSFLGIWKENQVVSTGDNVFTVVPSDTSFYLGRIKAEAVNSGKIEIGQKVNIRLANYPDREFGILEGNVSEISLIPDKDGYILIDVKLPGKLITSYGKHIAFRQEMTGTADIVTENLNLLQRILYQFRDVFSREKKETNQKKE